MLCKAAQTKVSGTSVEVGTPVDGSVHHVIIEDLQNEAFMVDSAANTEADVLLTKKMRLLTLVREVRDFAVVKDNEETKNFY